MPAPVTALAALSPFDRLLLAVLFPLWLAAFGLHVSAAFRSGLAQPGFFVNTAGPSEYPHVGGARKEQGSEMGGLRVGDRLVRAGKRDLRGVGNIAFDAITIAEAGSTGVVRIEYERADVIDSIDLRLVPLPVPWMRIPMLIAFAGTAAIVLLRGRGSTHARFMFAAFMGVAILQSPFHGVSYSATVTSKAVFYAGNVLVPPLVFSWLLHFPPGLPPVRTVMLWLPWLFVPVAALVRGSFALGGPIPPWASPVLAPVLDGLVVAIGLGLFTVNYRRADHAGRRRIKWVLYGTYVAGVPVVLVLFSVIADSSGAWYRIALMPPAIAVTAFPLSVLIAVVRHNLLDIDRLISATTSYSLLAVFFASATLYIVPMAAAQLGALMGWNPAVSQALVAVLIAAIVLPAYQRVKPVIDRMLFPERRAFEDGIRQLLSDLSSSESPDALTSRAGGELVRLLRPETCVIYRRTASEFAPVFAEGISARPIGHADPLIAILERRVAPVAAESSASHRRGSGLSPYERAALEELHVSVVAPVRGRQGLAALFSLGPKRSGDVYTATEVAWLSGVADRMAAGLLRFAKEPAAVAETATATKISARSGPRPPAMLLECPNCGRCFDGDTAICNFDGVMLAARRIDRVLSGRYQLERRLGKGGMGTVYEAVDLSLGRSVAVKIIREDVGTSGESADRFRREARATAAFAHPNVVVVHDFGVTGAGTPYLVLELLKGLTLREEMTRLRRLPTPRVLAITQTLCEVLDVAHRQSLVHRDLKPENVFLSSAEGRQIIKVLDFGLAKFKQSSGLREIDTTPGILVGTLPYMSPECFDMGEVRPSWDLWALAVMVYEMLGGARPFAGDAPAVQSAVRSGAFPAIVEYWPEAPPKLSAFFAHSLAPALSGRPPSAGTFAAALAEALAE